MKPYSERSLDVLIYIPSWLSVSVNFRGPFFDQGFWIKLFPRSTDGREQHTRLFDHNAVAFIVANEPCWCWWSPWLLHIYTTIVLPKHHFGSYVYGYFQTTSTINERVSIGPLNSSAPAWQQTLTVTHEVYWRIKQVTMCHSGSMSYIQLKTQ